MVRSDNQIRAQLSKGSSGTILLNEPDNVDIRTTIEEISEGTIREEVQPHNEDQGSQRKKKNKNNYKTRKLPSGKTILIRQYNEEPTVSLPPIGVPIPSTSNLEEDLDESTASEDDTGVKWVSSRQIPERNPVYTANKRKSRPPSIYRGNDYIHALRDPQAGTSGPTVQYIATSGKPIPSGINYVRDRKHVAEDAWPIIAVLDETKDSLVVVYDHTPRIRSYLELKKSQERHGGVLIDTVPKETANVDLLLTNHYNHRKRRPPRDGEIVSRSIDDMQELYHSCYTWYDKEVGTGGVSRKGGVPFEQDIALGLLEQYSQINRAHFDVLEDLFQKMVNEDRISFAFDFLDPSYELVFLAFVFEAWKSLPISSAAYVPHWMGKTAVKRDLNDEQVNDAVSMYPPVNDCKPLIASALRDLVNRLRTSDDGMKRDVLFLYLSTPELNNRDGVKAHTYLCIVSNSSLTGKRIIHVWDPAIDDNSPVPEPIRNLNTVINQAKRPVEYANGNQGEYDSGCLMRSLRLMALILGGLPWKVAFNFKPHSKYA